MRKDDLALYSRIVRHVLVCTPMGGAPIVAEVVERTPHRAFACAVSVGDFAPSGVVWARASLSLGRLRR
jgi:hypothetical protein